MTLKKANGNVFIVGAVVPKASSTPYLRTRLLLWEISRAGEKVREVTIGKIGRDEAERNQNDSHTFRMIDVDPRAVAGVFVTEDGGFVVVGNFGGETPVFVKLDSEGKTVLWKALPTRSGSVYIRKVFTAPNGDFLLVGQALTERHEPHGWRVEPLVLRVDPNGEKLWERIFEFKESKFAYLSAGFAIEDGGLLLVGSTGAGVGGGEREGREVFVARCDGNGNVQAEKRFAGRLPEACQIGGGKFAVIYDQETSSKQRFAAKAIGTELQELWEREIVQANFAMQPLKVASVPNGGLIVVGAVVDDVTLRVYQYDERGEWLKSLTVPLVHMPVQVAPVCSERVAFVVFGYPNPEIFVPLTTEIKLLGIPLEQRK